jgi:hypothetical protein
VLVGDVEELDKVWDTLDICYDRPEKYIAEALEPTYCHVQEVKGVRAFSYLRVLLSPQVSNDGGQEG